MSRIGDSTDTQTMSAIFVVPIVLVGSEEVVMDSQSVGLPSTLYKVSLIQDDKGA